MELLSQAAGGRDRVGGDTPTERGKVIGYLGGPRLPELGYGMNREFWHRGYMTEALLGLIETYWTNFEGGFPGLEGDERNFLMAITNERNLGSVAVLERCGFELWKKKVEVMKGEDVTNLTYRLWRP